MPKLLDLFGENQITERDLVSSPPKSLADMAAYRHFIGSGIWNLPGVRETRTYVVMEEVKCESGVVL